MENLNNRHVLRGTGRTTRALEAAVEYAKCVPRPAHSIPTAIFVISHKAEWSYIKHLSKKVTRTNEQQRRLDFGEVSIFVMVPEDGENKMRGFRCPIVLDHSVLEDKFEQGEQYEIAVNLLFHRYADRIITP